MAIKYYVKDGDVFELNAVPLPDNSGLWKVASYQCLTAQQQLPRTDIHNRYLIETANKAFAMQVEWLLGQKVLLQKKIKEIDSKVSKGQQVRSRLGKDIF